MKFSRPKLLAVLHWFLPILAVARRDLTGLVRETVMAVTFCASTLVSCRQRATQRARHEFSEFIYVDLGVFFIICHVCHVNSAGFPAATRATSGGN